MKLRVYDKYNNEVIFKLNKCDYVNSGCNAKVYKYDDHCVKILNIGFSYIIDVLETIKKIGSKNENLYTIRDFYYSNCAKGEKRILKAYKMDYYKPDKNNILTKPMDYTLDNLNDLRVLTIKLSKKNIMIDDLKYDNIVLGKDRMVVIDTDYYTKSNISYRRLKRYNIKQLVILLSGIYYEHVKELNNIPWRTLQNICYNMENMEYEDLMKDLSHYKYPIDYIYDKAKILTL